MKKLRTLLALMLIVAMTMGMTYAKTNDTGYEVGNLTKESKADKETIAVDFLKVKKADGEFKVKAKKTDELGLTTVRVDQLYNGLPVWASDMIVNIDSKGVVKSFVGKVMDFEDTLGKKVEKKLTSKEAVDAALADLGLSLTLDKAPKSELMVYWNEDLAAYAYEVELSYELPEPGRWVYHIDANTGAVLNKIDELVNARPVSVTFTAANTVVGVGTDVLGRTREILTNLPSTTYYMADMTRGNGIFTYDAETKTRLPGVYWTDADNVYNDSYDAPAVSSQYFLEVTYDYYAAKFGRDSFDDAGAKVVSSVHVGRDYNNAYWNGSQFAFGDGDGYVFYPLSGAVDVVAHEYTHAVTQYTADLVYQYESGALNEAMSDIMGTAVEFHLGEDPDWFMGEDITGPGLGLPYLRSMEDPTVCGDPDHYDDIYVGTSDNGGVHTNSGVINKVAYLIGAGGTHYGVTVQGQGVDAMENIFYRALTTYMVSSTNFAGARTACVLAATDLYGSSSPEVQSVMDAFTSVGIN